MKSAIVKPPSFARLNAQSSLTRGLVGLWGFGEGAGPTIYNAFSKRNGTGTGSFLWTMGDGGPVFQTDGSASTFADFGWADQSFGSGDFTISVRVAKLANSSGYSNFFGFTKWDISSSPALCDWGIFLSDVATGGTNKPGFGVSIGGSVYILDGSIAPALGKFSLVHGVRLGGNIFIYVDGVQSGTMAASAGAVNFSSSTIRTAVNTPGGNLNSNANWDLAALHSRALSPAEIFAWSKNPYSIFQRDRKMRTRSSPSTGYTLSVSAGTFAQTVGSVRLLHGRRLAVAKGTFTQTAESVRLLRGRRLAAAKATFTQTSQAVRLLRGLRLPCSHGTFALTGQAINLRKGRTLALAHAAFAVTAQAARLLRAGRLAVAKGTFTQTSQAARLLKGRVLKPARGSFALSGISPRLLRGAKLRAASGTYVLTAEPITLTYASGGSTAAAGTILLLEEDSY